MSILNMQLPMEPAAEDRWLGRYLDGELSSADAIAFEIYSLDKPRLLAVLDADLRLHQAFSRRPDRSAQLIGTPPANAVNEADAAASASPHPRVGGPAGRVPGARRHAFNGGWSAAACLLVGLFVGGIGGHWQAATPPNALVIANPTRIVYDVMRGAEQAPQVEHADSGSPYVVVDVALPAGASHIRLSGADRADQDLQLSADGFVSFLGSQHELGGHEYLIRYEQAGAERQRKLLVPVIAPAQGHG